MMREEINEDVEDDNNNIDYCNYIIGGGAL